MIIDAHVLLRAFFPDEQQVQAQAVIRDFVAGQVGLLAPTLPPYAITNYDAAYPDLAQVSEQPFLTADQRLYHAVQPDLPWVQWPGDYRAATRTNGEPTQE